MSRLAQGFQITGAAIGACSSPKVSAISASRTARICELNDTFRQSLAIGKQCVLTPGVFAMGAAFVTDALSAIRVFQDFNADGDPYGEHDFGVFSIADTFCVWKIDYYDLTLHFGSEDPADIAQTKRVLTVMLLEEY